MGRESDGLRDHNKNRYNGDREGGSDGDDRGKDGNKKPPERNSGNDDKKYDQDVIMATLFLYFIAIIIWLIIVKKIHDRDAIAILIVLIPIFIMFVSVLNLILAPEDISDKIFRSNYASVAVLICVPLLSWVNRDISSPRKKKFVFGSILAVIFALIGLYDCWVPCRWYIFIRQFKSISQTFAVTLLLYSLYSFYLEKDNDKIFTV